MFCDSTNNDEPYGKFVTFPMIETLAKRAPALGKDLTAQGDPIAVEVGAAKYPARAGHATGNLFKEDGGDVFWLDIRFEEKGTWHVYCVMTVKKSAGEDVRDEARAIMRSIAPPAGRKVLEPKMD